MDRGIRSNKPARRNRASAAHRGTRQAGMAVDPRGSSTRAVLAGTCQELLPSPCPGRPKPWRQTAQGPFRGVPPCRAPRGMRHGVAMGCQGTVPDLQSARRSHGVLSEISGRVSGLAGRPAEPRCLLAPGGAETPGPAVGREPCLRPGPVHPSSPFRAFDMPLIIVGTSLDWLLPRACQPCGPCGYRGGHGLPALVSCRVRWGVAD